MNYLVTNDGYLIPNLGLTIPKDVFELLWIKIGPLKKINHSDKEFSLPALEDFHKQKYNIKLEDRGLRGEPSLLDIKLPIRSTNLDVSDEGPLYDPCYRELSSSHRYLYLKWLSDITVKSNLSYVFLYFYGLERHLFLGNYEKAFDMVLRLLDLYGESRSFQGHATNSLIIAAYTHRDIDRLYQILTLSRHYTPTLLDNVLGIKYLLFPQVSVKDMRLLAGLSRKVLPGSGPRLMKEMGDTFESRMNSYLMHQYGVNSFPISEELLKDGRVIHHNRTCNRSLHYLFPYNSSTKHCDNIAFTYSVVDNKMLMQAISDIIRKCYYSDF